LPQIGAQMGKMQDRTDSIPKSALSAKRIEKAKHSG